MQRLSCISEQSRDLLNPPLCPVYIFVLCLASWKCCCSMTSVWLVTSVDFSGIHQFYRRLRFRLILNSWGISSMVVFCLWSCHAPFVDFSKILCLLQKYLKSDQSCNSREQSLLSQHLKVVRTICAPKENVIVDRILKIIRTHVVPLEQIDIRTFARLHYHQHFYLLASSLYITYVIRWKSEVKPKQNCMLYPDSPLIYTS